MSDCPYESYFEVNCFDSIIFGFEMRRLMKPLPIQIFELVLTVASSCVS